MIKTCNLEVTLYFGVLITVLLYAVQGINCTDANFTTPAAGNDSVTSGVLNSTQRLLSGKDLWCYECHESYRDANDNTRYDATHTPCLNNLSRITVRQCSEDDRYCQVERSQLAGTVLTIERGCTRRCAYGCRFNGFGLTTMRCRSCCNTHGCNVGNQACSHRKQPGWKLASWTLVVVALGLLFF